MPTTIKIIIVDDHEIFRKGLVNTLEKLDNIKVIGEADSAVTLMQLLNEKKPDIILMDINMPGIDGIEATKMVLDKYPGIKISALTYYGEEELLEEMLNAGAIGFILKSIDGKNIEFAIRELYKGKNFFSPELMRSFAEKYISPVEEKNTSRMLTKREMEILNLIAKGLSSKEIGAKLNISKRTVDGHKQKIFLKTGTNNIAALIIFAVKNKLIEI